MPVKRLLRKLSALRRSEAPSNTFFSAPRQHPRVHLVTDVRVEGHDLAFTTRSVHLGTNGMSLEHAGQLSLAQPVLVTFALPSGSRVKVSAVVRWITKEMVGLRFDPRDHNRPIQEWVQSSAAAELPT